MAGDVDGGIDTQNANVDPDAKEMATYWSSIEAFVTSSSSDSIATATAEGAVVSGGLDFNKTFPHGSEVFYLVLTVFFNTFRGHSATS